MLQGTTRGYSHQQKRPLYTEATTNIKDSPGNYISKEGVLFWNTFYEAQGC